MRVALIAGLLLLSTGCAKGALGEECKETSDCGTGLSCVLYGGREIVGADLTCNANKKLCSITCGADAECAAVGTGTICVKECYQGSCLKGSRS